MFVKRRKHTAEHIYTFMNSKMGYSVTGKGRPVILLHGSIISNPWRGFEKELGKYYKVYTPHLPGFGSSDAVKGKRHSIDLFSNALCKFVNEMRLNDAPVVALSLGSIVALNAAAKRCVKGELVLVGMPGIVVDKRIKQLTYVPTWIRRLFGSTEWVRKRIVIPGVLNAVEGKPEKRKVDEVFENMRELDTKALVDPDPYNEIVLRIPALLNTVINKKTFIYGETDKLLTSSKSLIANPILIKNSGHNVFSKQPQETLKALRGILK